LPIPTRKWQPEVPRSARDIEHAASPEPKPPSTGAPPEDDPDPEPDEDPDEEPDDDPAPEELVPDEPPSGEDDELLVQPADSAKTSSERLGYANA
jgi:hypothetical protein